jgi:hypothetical protein
MLKTISKPAQYPALKSVAENDREHTTRILREFASYQEKLQEWAGRCTVNAIWYLADPFGAMRSANLGIDEKRISELETLHAEFNRKREMTQIRRTA